MFCTETTKRSGIKRPIPLLGSTTCEGDLSVAENHKLNMDYCGVAEINC